MNEKTTKSMQYNIEQCTACCIMTRSPTYYIYAYVPHCKPYTIDCVRHSQHSTYMHTCAAPLTCVCGFWGQAWAHIPR